MSLSRLGFCRISAMVTAIGALAACSAAQQAQAVAQLKVVCQVDGNLVPVVNTVAATLDPALTGVTAIDAALVHPAVQAACAQLGGTPVAVSHVGASVAPSAAKGA